MVSGKDSAEVVQFMALLAQVKNCCGDGPKRLPELAKEDERVESLFCIKLSDTASFLTMNERRYRQLFAVPVDTHFLTAWRDFEDRYYKPLAGIWLARFAHYLRQLDNTEAGQSDADVQWDNANHEGVEQALKFCLRASLERPFSERPSGEY
jgi:hypothetical protein